MTHVASTPPVVSITASYRQRVSQLQPLVASASSLTFNDFRRHIQRQLALPAGEAFTVEWVDDDNIWYRIEDDAALHDALDYFSPLSHLGTMATSEPSSSKRPTPSPIEMSVRIQDHSRISLSETSSGRSSKSGSSQYYDGSSTHSGKTQSPPRPPLNGRDRLASLDSSDEEGEDDTRTEYPPPSSHQNDFEISFKYKDPASMLPTHSGVCCEVCQKEPIRGVRYVCLHCEGCPSFCHSCEDAGESIQYAPHLGTHMVLRLIEPLSHQSYPEVDKVVQSGTVRLQIGAISAKSSASGTISRVTSHSHSLNAVPAGTTSSDTPSSRPTGHDVLCSFCSELIGQGARYLCANCPLDLASQGSSSSPGTAAPTGRFADGDPHLGVDEDPRCSAFTIWTPHEGFNLCSECEKHSLSIHNPDHFFIYIPPPEQIARGGNAIITPLRLNPYLTIEQRKGLLPLLYMEDRSWEEAKERIRSGLPPAIEAASPSSSPSAIRPAFPPAGQVDRSAAALIAAAGPTEERSATTISRIAAWRRMAASENIELARMSIAEPEAENAPSEPSREADFEQVEGTSPREEDKAFSPAYLQHEEEYVRSLSHTNVLCDVCFEQVTGCWVRCVNCVTSFDLCMACLPKALKTHASSHSFAMFKRQVDIDLYRSLVDHIDGQDGEETWASQTGPKRAMIEFLLV